MTKDDRNLKEDTRVRIITDRSLSRLDMILKSINQSSLLKLQKDKIKYDLATRIINDVKKPKL